MRYDSKHKARTRDKVLVEAAAAIRRDGPDRLGVAAVMARAGLTHGGFYAHFASRDDLLAAAVVYMLDERYSAFFAEVDDVDPRAALLHFVDRYLSMRHRDRPDRGCPIPILSGHLQRLPQAARGHIVASVDRLTTAMITLLCRSGMAEPHSRAQSAIAEMVGAIVLARTIKDDDAAARLLACTRASVEEKLGLTPRHSDQNLCADVCSPTDMIRHGSMSGG